MVRPIVGEIPFQVIKEFGRGIVGTVMPDTEYGGIGSVRVGLDKCVRCKESVGQIDYEVKCEDNFSPISGMPLKVMF